MTEERPYSEQLPWLQPVVDEDEPRGVSAGKMLAALLVVMLAAAILAATFFWLGREQGPETAAPEIIRAPPEPYKVKPPNPGGLDIRGQSETAFETSAGEDNDARLDLDKLPETPVAKPPKPKPEPKEEPKRIPPNETKEPVTERSAHATPTGGAGSVIQLGAFANQAQAERAWTALSNRFPSVAAMNKLIVAFPGGIRLRAAATSPAEAKQACQALKAAGENCFVAQ